jgi:hypothetical protein
MECPHHAERVQVQLPRLEFQTHLVGQITQKNGRKVRIPGFWADTGKFGKYYPNAAALEQSGVMRTRERFKRWKKAFSQSLFKRNNILKKHSVNPSCKF